MFHEIMDIVNRIQLKSTQINTNKITNINIAVINLMECKVLVVYSIQLQFCKTIGIKLIVHDSSCGTKWMQNVLIHYLIVLTDALYKYQ